jgi:hypothetical protein
MDIAELKDIDRNCGTGLMTVVGAAVCSSGRRTLLCTSMEMVACWNLAKLRFELLVLVS